MSGPQRIRLSRAKGWRMPVGAVNCARPGKWGNPFIVGKHGTRAECVGALINLALGFVNLSGDVDVEVQRALYRRIKRNIGTLAGADLACWCSLDGPCHVDAYLILANNRPLTELNALTVEPRRPSIGILAADLDALERKRRAA